MDNRAKLQAAVQAAIALLQTTQNTVSEADRIALQEQVAFAEAALAGIDVPFSRCRAFVRREDTDQVAFALRHYSMAPTYLPQGRVYTTYGLLDAIEWYRTRIGTPCAVRSAAPLASETQAERGGLFSNAELRQLWKQAERNPLLAQTLAGICREADRLSLEQMQQRYQSSFAPDDYETMNHTECPWSDSNMLVTFSAPAETRSAVFSFMLPSRDNETDGLGHIWLDDLCLIGADGNRSLPNGGFEEGMAGWQIDGDGSCKIETRAGFCGQEQASLFLQNETKVSFIRVTTATPVSLQSGSYTLRFKAKIDGVLKQGLKIEAVFYDAAHRTTGTYETTFNEKSWPADAMRYNLTMQCCALRYAVTGDLQYAQKTKIAILHFLDNFCQGVEFWQVYNARPGGSDAYGAVQGGRNLCALAVSYAAIREAGVFSDAEKQRFYALVDYLLHNMMDLRDRAALGFETAQRNTTNWQTDMSIGTAMMASVLTDLPHRRQWWDNAYAVLRGQLEANLNPDGSWPESLRYHHAALEHFALYALLLYRETGENWFAQSPLQKMFRYGIAVQTPPLQYFGGCITTPPFGDHRFNGGEEYALYSEFIVPMAVTEPELADEMKATWRKAGCKLPPLRGEAVIALLLRAPNEAGAAACETELPVYSAFPQAGLYIYRHKSGNYLAVMSSPKKIGHGHLDQGSFILFYKGVPLVVDTGIEGYFDASTPWHLCSMSHACLQFHCARVKAAAGGGLINLSAGTYSAERGLCDTPGFSRVLSANAEGIEIEIDQLNGSGKHRRAIKFDPASGQALVRDTVIGYDGFVTASLPLAAKSVELVPEGAVCRGFYGQNLYIKFETTIDSIQVEKGRSTRFFPSEDEIPQTYHLHVTARAQDGVTMRLIPFTK